MDCGGSPICQGALKALAGLLGCRLKGAMMIDIRVSPELSYVLAVAWWALWTVWSGINCAASALHVRDGKRVAAATLALAAAIASMVSVVALHDVAKWYAILAQLRGW